MTERIKVEHGYRCSNCDSFVKEEATECWACKEDFANIKKTLTKKAIDKNPVKKLSCKKCKSVQKNQDAKTISKK